VSPRPGTSSRRTSRARSHAGLVFTVLAAVGGIVASPGPADAHVNRQVGPYTILVVLVEEPTFDDNHAGFEFWVRRDGQPILGLQGSVRAEATGHGSRVDLTVPPVDGTGFYVLDRTSAGDAFDPLGGGPWTLHLTGSIEQTPLDESLEVTFPSYPRVGTPRAVESARSTATQGLPAPVLLLGGLAMAGAALLGIVVVRRGRSRPATRGQPLVETSRTG
jgi:hypothetical protein